MATVDSVQSFEARLSLYALDDRSRRILAETWPVIAPSLEGAIDHIIAAAGRLPSVGAVITQNVVMLKKLELAHLQALLGGKLDQHYAESCRTTVLQEAAIGLDARIRSTAGSYAFKAALDALARKHRLSPTRLVERAKGGSQVISFDVRNAMTLHRQARERANLDRRKALDEAIGDFAGAIGEVVEAIKETSVSLTATSQTLNQAADDTRGRMTAASSASAETARRMDATVTATEELSGSIEEIGRQAARGL